MKDLSIIIPTYNSCSKLLKLIESVTKQNLKYDYEIVIIDDGSKDNTAVECRKIMKNNKKIIYKYQENSGVSKARNVGIEISCGNFIMFADADDYYCNDTLNEVIGKMDGYDLIITGYNRINIENGKSISKRINMREYNLNEYDILIEKLQENNLFNQIWNKIYKRDIIKNNNLFFDEKIEYGEDYQFNIKYLFCTKKILVLSNVIYNYFNEINGLNNTYRRNRFDLNRNNLFLLEEYFKKNNLNIEYINKKYFITLISGINNICKNDNSKERKNDLLKLCYDNQTYMYLKRNKSLKAKILMNLLKTKNTFLLELLGKIIKIYERKYKKRKLGY